MDDNGQLFGGNVVGVGVDLTDVERIRSMLEKYPDTFLARTFTDAEIAYCAPRANKAEAFAARFAAKEAVVKALGTGFRGRLRPKASVSKIPKTAHRALFWTPPQRTPCAQSAGKKCS